MTATIAAPELAESLDRPSRGRTPPVEALSLVGGLILWEIVARLWNVVFLPPPSEVAARLWDLTVSGQIVGNLLNSLGNLAIGFGVSVIAGIALGAAMARFRRLEQALDVFVYTLLTAPSLVFAPIYFSIFGLGSASIIALIIQNAVFIVVVNTLDGLRATPSALIEMARSFGAGEWTIYRRVAFPSAIPVIMVGIQQAAAAAVKGMVTGEMFLAIVGLGGIIVSSGKRFDAAGVLAIVVLVLAIALILSWLLALLERRLTRWLPADRS